MTAFSVGTSLTQRPGNQRPGTNFTNESPLIPEKDMQRTSEHPENLPPPAAPLPRTRSGWN